MRPRSAASLTPAAPTSGGRRGGFHEGGAAVCLPTTVVLPSPFCLSTGEPLHSGNSRDHYTRLDVLIRAVAESASRADHDAIQYALRELGAAGLLDEHTAGFLRRSRGLVLGTAIALSATISAHH